MEVVYSHRFKKQYKKFPTELRAKVIERIGIFMDDTMNPLLNNHALAGEYRACCSINVTGNVRIIYEVQEDGTILLIAVGTHSELYGR